MCNGFDVMHKGCREVHLTLFFAYNAMQLGMAKIEKVMVFTYQDIGHMFHKRILHIFCNGWMDYRDAFSLFAYTAV